VLSYYSPAGPLCRARETAIVVGLALLLSAGSVLPVLGRFLGPLWPNWPVIFSTYLAWRTRPYLAAVGAFLMGAFSDALTLVPEGLTSLALVVAVLGQGYLSKHIRLEGSVQLVVVCSLLTIVIDLIFIPVFLRIMGYWDQPNPVIGSILVGGVLGALVTGLVSPLAFSFLDRAFSSSERR
jgi:rod shape-determining protein MreD